MTNSDEKMANPELEEQCLSTHFSKRPRSFAEYLKSNYDPNDPLVKEIVGILDDEGSENF